MEAEPILHRNLSLLVRAVLLILASTLELSGAASAANFLNHLSDWNSLSHTFGDSGYSIGVDTKVLFKGKPSAVFHAARPDQTPKEFYVLIWQNFSAEKYRGKRLEFSGFVKTDDKTGWADAFVKVKRDGEVVGFDNMDNRRIVKTNGWHPFSIVLDVPPSSTTIDIGFYVTGGGSAWLNGLAVRTVDNNRKTTAVAWDSKKYHDYTWELDDQPSNLDFAMLAHEEGPKQLMSWATHDDTGAYDISVDRGTVYNGKPSACLQSKVPDAGDFALLYQEVAATKYRGKRVELSGFVKTKDVNDWTGLWLRVDGDHDVLAFDNMEDRPIKGTSDWHRYSVVLDVPEQSKKLRLGAMIAGTGRAWINSLSLEPITNNTPVTQQAIDLKNVPREQIQQAPILEFHAR